MGTKKGCQVDNDYLISVPLFEKAKYVEVSKDNLRLFD